MQKKKLIGLALVMTFVLVSLVSFTSAITLLTPASSGKISGTYWFNVSLNGADLVNQVGMWNCSINLKSASLTANSTYTLVGNLSTNVTNGIGTNVSQGAFSLSNKYEDANDYIVNVTCSNDTTKFAQTTTSGITVDYTVPVAPSSLSPADLTQITSATTQTFSGTVVDNKTTSCTYIIGRGGISTDSADTTTTSGTYSTTSCSFTKTFSDTDDNGIWYWRLTASDETNTTDSGVNTIQVNIPPVGGSGTPTTTGTGTTTSAGVSSNTVLWIVGIIAGVIVLVIIVLRIIKG